jgi:hypothetical protein
MKFGVRTPSLKRRIAARTSVKRMVREKVRAPRGYGFVTNPKRALYNRAYNRTSVSVDTLLMPKSTTRHATIAGHGTLWWLFIGWWWIIVRIEFKIIVWFTRLAIKAVKRDQD